MSAPHALSRRDPEARRAQVVTAATRLFAERGYENTSVNHVADAAGVSVGALYKYFPDKPSLLEAVLQSFQEDFVSGMAAMHARPGTHFERLRQMVHGLFELAGSREAFFWALTSGTHGLRGARVYEPGAALREEIRRFVESGMAAGEFRPVDAQRVAALGYGVVETAMRHCFGPGEQGAHRVEWEHAVYELLARNVRPD